MIQCQQCKGENPSTVTHCQKCGADLLPGISRGRRILGVSLGVLLGLILAIPAAAVIRQPRFVSGGAGQTGTSIVTCLFVGAFLIPALAIYVSLRKTPDPLRYKMRARRHVSIDPRQAFEDFTRVVERIPSDLEAWKGRGSLYDRLDWSVDDLRKEIVRLTEALPKRRGNVKNEVANHVIRLHDTLIRGLQSAGRGQEATRDQLAVLDFVEANVDSLVQFKTDAVGFGTGVTQGVRRDIRKQVQESRQALAQGGLITALGYCPICKQWVVATPELQCPNYETHKHLSDLRFVMPDEVDRVIGTLQGKT